MGTKKDMEILASRQQELEVLENIIKNQASGNLRLQILEAGCGRRWPFKLEGVDYTLTGVDKDVDALEIRRTRENDLHEEIEGDLRWVDLGQESFDVIYCSYVLEHVKEADLVMQNFINWLKPNGIIIIKVPNPRAVKGFLTVATPHWFHVFYHRFLLEYKNAGKPGCGPYETYFHPIVSRNGMGEFCGDENPLIELEAEYLEGYFRPGRYSIKALLFIFKRLVSLLSLGTLDPKHSNLIYVIRKTQA